MPSPIKLTDSELDAVRPRRGRSDLLCVIPFLRAGRTRCRMRGNRPRCGPRAHTCAELQRQFFHPPDFGAGMTAKYR
jgi:hypothetical protein